MMCQRLAADGIYSLSKPCTQHSGGFDRKKKKKPSWHPCLESSSIESALGCSVHRQSPKGPFLGGKICAQSYVFCFVFLRMTAQKKWQRVIEVDAITCTSVHLLYIERLLPGVSLLLTSARGSVTLHLVAFKCCGKNVTACNSGSNGVNQN